VSPRRARRLPASLPRRPRGGLRPPGDRGAPAAADAAAARLGPPQVQAWPDGDWIVRQVPGAAAAKAYRCPGCDQEIWPGTAHVVTWPDQAPGPAERRHWHSACWQRRPRRPGPGPRTHR